MTGRRRTTAAFGASAGGDEARRSASLPLESRHGVRPFLALLFRRLSSFLGALLAACDRLRGNEMDVGAAIR